MRRDVRILLVGDGEQFSRPSTRKMWVTPFRILIRGCREEHHRYFTYKGVVCGTCELFIDCYIHGISQKYRPLKVQHVVPEVTIPPEVTPENVTTYIVDSGCELICHVSDSPLLYFPGIRHTTGSSSPRIRDS